MDLDDVRIFTKVAEAGSFTRAAQLLGMPKSTVSRRVAELEDKLNVLLIQRSTRRLTLTPAGQLYFERTSRAIADLKQAEVALEEMRGEPRGMLRITTPSDMAGLVPRLIGEFRKDYPLVQLVVFSTARRVDLIAEGYDLALRAAARLSDSTMFSKKIIDTRFGTFASPAYLTEHGTPQTPADLEKHDCLTFGTETLNAEWNLLHTETTESTGIHVAGSLASNDHNFLMGACLRGLGIAFLPTFEASRQVAQGRLVRVLPSYTSEFGSLYAVYPSGRHVSPNVRAFVDFSANWFNASENLWNTRCSE
jgi:DNA-binding transcriptional LysR family regulator